MKEKVEQDRVPAKEGTQATTTVEIDRPLVFFTSVFALASLFQLGFQLIPGHESSPFTRPSFPAVASWICLGFIGIASASVLLRPKSAIPLILLAAAHVLDTLWRLPRWNAADLIWFTGSAMILSSAAVHSGVRLRRIPCRALLQWSAPGLRLLFLIVLPLMTLARWNTSFLQRQQNRAVEQMGSVLMELFPGQAANPSWLIFTLMAALLLMEWVVLLSLVFSSQRKFGVVLGFVYFGVLAYLGFPGSAALFPALIPLLTLFVGDETWDPTFRFSQNWIPNARQCWMLPVLALILLAAFLVLHIWPDELASLTARIAIPSDGIRWFPRGLCVMAGVGWGILLFAGLWARWGRRDRLAFRTLNPFHYGILILVVLAGIAPFLGLGEVAHLGGETQFVAGRSANNHLLIPQGNLVPFGHDWVQVIAAESPELQEIVENDLLLPWVEFERFLRQNPSSPVQYRRSGEFYELTQGLASLQRTEQLPWYIRKCLAYNLVTRERVDSLVTREKEARKSREFSISSRKSPSKDRMNLVGVDGIH